MSHRLARAALSCALLIAVSLTSAVGVAAQSTGTFASTAGAAAQSGADLSISMTGPARVKSGATVVYTITVKNLGPATASRIWIGGGGGDQFDPLSVHCQDNGSFGQGACYPADLAPAASVVATYTVRVCCLVRGERRRTSVGAGVAQDVVPDPDPNPDNNWVQLAVYITGGHVK